MSQTKRSESDKQDESSRRGKTTRVTIDLKQLTAVSDLQIKDDRWLESLLEDPERWDGMS